jgi:uncharacterized glyoxalase superfamily protein PhnB
MSEHQSIFPTLRYRDADAAVAWLGRAFGFEEQAIHRGEDGTIQHAELRLGSSMIMLGQHRPGGFFGDTPPDPAASGQGIYVVLDDVDAHHDRARAAGADVIQELTDQDYGSREYGARDLEGNLWSFGTYDPFAA